MKHGSPVDIKPRLVWKKRQATYIREIAERKRLYAHEFPLITTSLRRLRERLAYENDGTLALVLFGSVARLTPTDTSDLDLLALLDHDSPASERARADALYNQILEAFYPSGSAWTRWGACLITSDARASDLESDFVDVVGQEGVLIYRRDDAELPPALAHLTPVAEWLGRVDALVAACAS
jgi:predicted nucleotidyltransferase